MFTRCKSNSFIKLNIQYVVLYKYLLSKDLYYCDDRFKKCPALSYSGFQAFDSRRDWA
ncbi:uncharacterized protein PHALS_06864 [Plasmopara halstedii]|uniref:Uncharacterized protein n=1 Tax=Plasmopara halstedii TaxID=4781 RepID=A0A0P1B534_PLAHL|nr:uncharacterized protein PHALS_02144 [Plasmopara halstedii]XP_024585447.1 uncharacterized protein PHALS_06864 [Plasmopara halstedii]CEG45871.1 hypothetical protein PHALS_02144 [Plasmopara halstedii]CEG49078.1 hypothetical protein PHALS_06864 [Plasmopara halstedii]|eukprot:XP_024582240.1 hypothetical protein PHALS_02144 [Plasmopara halstedii]